MVLSNAGKAAGLPAETNETMGRPPRPGAGRWIPYGRAAPACLTEPEQGKTFISGPKS